MAHKELILNADVDIKTKVYALILCIAGDFEAATGKILGEFNLSKLQLDILHELHLAEGNTLSIGEIKSKMVSDSPNVSRSVNKLMDNGFIEKERTLDDQRVVKVKITKRGKKVHRSADEAKVSLVDTTGLSQKELESLYNILAKM